MPYRENTPSGKPQEPMPPSRGTREVAKAIGGRDTAGVKFDRLSMAKDKPHHGTKTR